ncbi:MAG: hypothetical protein O2873_00455 [Proteobacteria bacterium]|jgi:hypothetical protein|nr:hypothetical protein [Pseudomonadota bacterium]
MAKATPVALTKQLQRELRHQQWLRKNLPPKLQAQSQRRIFITRTKLAVVLGRSVEL